MDFYMYHGRLKDHGRATDLDGNEIDDWGFDGPRLHGVVGFHCTYGVYGFWNLWFATEADRATAQKLTGWDEWEDKALTVKFTKGNDMVCIWNQERSRHEYFGDWGII